MFGISWNEYILIAIVALIVIGPKELPGVLRAIGQWTTKVRRMAAEFQGQFHEAMREAEMSDLKKEVDDLSAQARGFTSQFSDPENLWEYKPEPKPEPALPASPDKADAATAPAGDAPAAAAPGVTAAEPVAGAPASGEHGAGQGTAAAPAEHAETTATATAASEPPASATAASEPAAPETAGAKG
jgi:sec-independent protein translocase protein TatB